MYFDIDLKIRTDSSFRNRLADLLAEHDELSKKIVLDHTLRSRRDELTLAVSKHCGYNMAVWLPWYFPSFGRDPMTNKPSPMTLDLYPQCYPLYSLQLGGYQVLRGSRQMGKSQSMTGRQLIHAHVYPGFRSLYITPHYKQLKTYSDKLKEAWTAFRLHRKITGAPQNLFYREFPHLANKKQISVVKLAYVLTSASPVRGNSFDEILYDEFQDFDLNLWHEVDEILSASPFKVALYAGTSLTTDTALEHFYANSSRGVWAVRCPACNFENWGDLDCEHETKSGRRDVFDMIQPDGLHCIKCDRRINPRNGRWMWRNQRMAEVNQLGFHVPQIMVPAILRDVERWQKINYKKVTLDSRKFLQENLGIPTEQGEREITLSHLQGMCILGHRKDLQDKARRRQYDLVISGVDWGGADYEAKHRLKASYTVHTMIGVTHEKKFEIIHMRDYSGMFFLDIIASILSDHFSLMGNALCSDFGGGKEYNMLIRKKLDSRHHMVLDYNPSPYAPMIDLFSKSVPDNFYLLNRNDSLTQLFDFIKYGRLHCYNWDEAGEKLMDFLAIRRHPQETASGRKVMRYLPDASKPDDTAHSLNLACTLARILLGEPLFSDPSVRRKIENSFSIARPSAPAAATMVPRIIWSND